MEIELNIMENSIVIRNCDVSNEDKEQKLFVHIFKFKSGPYALRYVDGASAYLLDGVGLVYCEDRDGFLGILKDDVSVSGILHNLDIYSDTHVLTPTQTVWMDSIIYKIEK